MSYEGQVTNFQVDKSLENLLHNIYNRADDAMAILRNRKHIGKDYYGDVYESLENIKFKIRDIMRQLEGDDND